MRLGSRRNRRVDPLNSLSGGKRGAIGCIRACPVCHRYFIPWREDQRACSRRGANPVRIRRFRGKALEMTVRPHVLTLGWFRVWLVSCR